MAVTFGTFRSEANCACVNPKLARMARICFAGIGFTGGGSFTVRSTAGSSPRRIPRLATKARSHRIRFLSFWFSFSSVVSAFDGFECHPQACKDCGWDARLSGFRIEHEKNEAPRIWQPQVNDPRSRTSAAPWQFHPSLAQPPRMPDQITALGIGRKFGIGARFLHRPRASPPE